ncbi:rhomboid protease [Sarracenia purpurea var. burkii]
MQKRLSLKLALKQLRNHCNTSPHFHSNPNHFNRYSPINRTHHFFSPASRPWRSSVSDKINGFISNPLLVKELLPNTISKVIGRGLVDGRVEFLKIQLPKRSFEINPSNEARRWQSWLRRLTPDRVVLGLILTNVAVFMLWRIADQQFMFKNFTISVENFKSGRVHTLITSAFSHIDMGHLISNMVGLYFFGMNIGSAFGPEFVLKLYLSGAIVGSIFYLVHHAFTALSSKNERNWSKNHSRIPGLGASGAVNAIMLLDIFLFPKSTLYLEFIIPVPAILLGIFLIGKDMLRVLEEDSHISGSAHLGGAVVAAIAWARIRKRLF